MTPEEHAAAMVGELWEAMNYGGQPEFRKICLQHLRRALAAEREACAQAICWRCRAGHPVFRETWGGYSHGTDGAGTPGCYYPPEPCEAQRIWKRGEEGER